MFGRRHPSTHGLEAGAMEQIKYDKSSETQTRNTTHARVFPGHKNLFPVRLVTLEVFHLCGFRGILLLDVTSS